MTDESRNPICQWCGQPALGVPTRWDDQPQCGDPFACAKRIEAAEPVPPAEDKTK
ncbi:hypothetical protein ACFW9I_22795 [[Kitasatospora] papulosa]|uniref:hypothetical protein n=1 Tax=[Kitasatospora] papulosa TaxID=1464011 RepID=UPI0036BA0207